MARNRNDLLSPREIEGLIACGQRIVIREGYAMRLDGWLDKHPGGHLAILHMVGRDATDEINVYHSALTLRSMKAYRIGRIQQPWLNLEPPIRGGVYREYVEQDLGGCDHADSRHDGSGCSADSAPLSLKATSVDQCTIAREHEAANVAMSKRESLEQENAEVSCNLQTASPATGKKSNSAACNEFGSTETLSRAAHTAAWERQEIADGILAYPSLDIETQRAITREYQALQRRVEDEGFYECRYSEYGKDALRWTLLFGVFLLLLNAKYYLSSALFLGMFWHQIMFVAHDAGHRGITGKFVTDTLIGIFIADFCCGLSLGWWKSSHNVHHLVTNKPEHDPDIQNIPLFANSPEFFKPGRSSFYNAPLAWDAAADHMVLHQKWTYYPIMAVARFQLYLLSWMHLLSPRAIQVGSAWWTLPTEISMMLCYWFLFGYCLVWCTLPTWPTRVAFVLTSHSITMLLHVQITLSHWGMPTADLGPTESFAQNQLRTTMDVDCPAWLDFLHGGLQFQAEHHLFPRVPRHNLRRLQILVREFCAKTQITHQCHGFVGGNKIVLTRLEEVAKMVQTLVECQNHMAKTGESGLH